MFSKLSATPSQHISHAEERSATIIKIACPDNEGTDSLHVETIWDAFLFLVHHLLLRLLEIRMGHLSTRKQHISNAK